MIISSASQSLSAAKMMIGNRSVQGLESAGSGLTVKSAQASAAGSSSAKATSIYDNFGREMSKRLSEAAKKSANQEDQPADPALLVQSLTGAMGEIEQIFGREAATEVMAGILSGTAGEVSEDSLLTAIQNSLTGLKRRDPNGTNLKRLAESFNRDLTLTLDPEAAEKKLADKETVSLSYALSRHFGSLVEPQADEALGSQKPAGGDGAAEEDSLSGSAGALSGGQQAAGPKIASGTYEMLGFNENGRWDMVEVVKTEAAEAEELKEAAEAGLDKVLELTLADVMGHQNGQYLFDNLAGFLANDLQDKESAAFVEQGVMDSMDLMYNKYGSSPKIAALLSQVYSKVAADGDADKLALFENYINTDFKNALNPVLADLQRTNPELLPGAEVGELQFKGLSGASLAGENDVFSLRWGYKDDNSYDRSIAKRFLQEDIRGVKAVKENRDRIAQSQMIRDWDESAEEKRLREEKEAKTIREAGGDQPQNALSAAEGRAGAEVSDLRTSLEERFSAERRQGQLEEALATKFGQLSDSSREELEQYLKNNFTEERAENLLDQARWNNDVLSGLAGIHRDIRETEGDEKKAADFMRFLNGTMKTELNKVTEKLDGLAFGGWQAPEALNGELEAAFNFTGQDQTVKVLTPDLAPAAPNEGDPKLNSRLQAERILQPPSAETADQARDARAAALFPRKMGTGYLINIRA